MWGNTQLVLVLIFLQPISIYKEGPNPDFTAFHCALLLCLLIYFTVANCVT